MALGFLPNSLNPNIFIYTMGTNTLFLPYGLNVGNAQNIIGIYIFSISIIRSTTLILSFLHLPMEERAVSSEEFFNKHAHF